MDHVTQSGENAKEIWRNSLNYVTFQVGCRRVTQSPTYLGYTWGRIILQLLLSPDVELRKCLEKALSLVRYTKRIATLLLLPALFSHVALVTSPPSQTVRLAGVLEPL